MTVREAVMQKGKQLDCYDRFMRIDAYKYKAVSERTIDEEDDASIYEHVESARIDYYKAWFTYLDCFENEL